MTKLTDQEMAAAIALRDYWQSHAETCDMIGNRFMAERQKANDLLRVSALTKLIEHYERTRG